MTKALCCWKTKREDNRWKPKPTPLPWRKVVVISLVVFVGQFGTVMIFPFLPFMVHDFFPELSRQELGQKAGFLGGAYFAGNFIGSLLWGWLSDVFGRRPVLLCGLCGIIGSELLFGFSQNFGWAIAARLLWGLLNGNLGVAKTYISEICDDTNQAKGFSIIGSMSGIGRLTGSVVGGFLSQPASKYSILELPLFCKYPYVLPCLVGASFGVIALITSSPGRVKERKTSFAPSHGLGMRLGTYGASAFFCLEETSKKKKKTKKTNVNSELNSEDSGLELTSQNGDEEVELYETNQIAESDLDSQSDFEIVSSDVELLVEQRGESRNQTKFQSPMATMRRIKHQTLSCHKQCLSCCLSCKNDCISGKAPVIVLAKVRSGAAKLKKMILLMRDRGVFISTLLYGLMSFAGIISNELFPLLLVTNYIGGGYNMDDSEIGVIVMVAGVIQLSWQLLVYSRIAKCLGFRRTFQVGVLLFGTVCVLIPFSNKISGPVPGSSTSSNVTDLWSGSGSGNSTDFCGDDSDDGVGVNEDSMERIPYYIWLLLSLVYGAMVISRITSFTSVMVLISNSALPETRGTVNGIAQALSSLGRSVGPIVGSVLFAWSENNGYGWPLNYHFVFEVCAIFGVVIIGVSLLLPKTIEKKRDTLEGTNT